MLLKLYIFFLALTYNCHKQQPQNACRYKKSGTLSGIQNNVAGLHKVQELYLTQTKQNLSHRWPKVAQHNYFVVAPVNKSINESIDRPTDQQTNQSINEPTDRPIQSKSQ